MPSGQSPTRATGLPNLNADASRVEASWEHAVALNEFHVDLRRALKEAEKAYERTPTEGTLAAILEIQQRLGTRQRH